MTHHLRCAPSVVKSNESNGIAHPSPGLAREGPPRDGRPYESPTPRELRRTGDGSPRYTTSLRLDAVAGSQPKVAPPRGTTLGYESGQDLQLQRSCAGWNTVARYTTSLRLDAVAGSQPKVAPLCNLVEVGCCGGQPTQGSPALRDNLGLCDAIPLGLDVWLSSCFFETDHGHTFP